MKTYTIVFFYKKESSNEWIQNTPFNGDDPQERFEYWLSLNVNPDANDPIIEVRALVSRLVLEFDGTLQGYTHYKVFSKVYEKKRRKIINKRDNDAISAT